MTQTTSQGSAYDNPLRGDKDSYCSQCGANYDLSHLVDESVDKALEARLGTIFGEVEDRSEEQVASGRNYINSTTIGAVAKVVGYFTLANAIAPEGYVLLANSGAALLSGGEMLISFGAGSGIDFLSSKITEIQERLKINESRKDK